MESIRPNAGRTALGGIKVGVRQRAEASAARMRKPYPETHDTSPSSSTSSSQFDTRFQRKHAQVTYNLARGAEVSFREGLEEDLKELERQKRERRGYEGEYLTYHCILYI